MNYKIIFQMLATLKTRLSVCLSSHSLFPRFLQLILIILLSTILAPHSHSAEVTLAWDLDGEASVTGYYLYYGLESGNYSTKIDVGYESQYTLIDLDDLKSYYFAATAYNEFDESDFSEELIYASYVCEADFDRDGDVDGADLAEFSADFGRTDCHSAGDCAGDTDYDGDVDGADLAEFSADFGRTDCP
jgi:hypothetical protein